MSRVFLFLSLAVYHCGSFSSFVGLDVALGPICGANTGKIVERVRTEHNKLTSIQKKLSVALPKSNFDEPLSVLLQAAVPIGSSPIDNGGTKSSRLSVSGSQITKSTNGTILEDLENSNFGLISLLIVQKSGKILPMAVYPQNDLMMGEFSRVYDSCVDRSHNIIPDLADFEIQWSSYLYPKHYILGEKMHMVKKAIHTALENIRTEIKALNEIEDASVVPEKIDQILNNLKTYHGRYKTLIRSGWHTEQRIVFDLDQSDTLVPLRNLKRFLEKEQDPVLAVIACLHTERSPCSMIKSCDCLSCLKNWSERWSFRSENPDIPVFMTVSYEKLYVANPDQFLDYVSKEDYTQSIRSVPGNNFFIDKFSPSISTQNRDILNDVRSWAAQGFLVRQLNRVRGGSGPVSAYDDHLFNAITPLIGEFKISYNASSDIVDCRSFKIVTPNLGLEKIYTDKDGFLLRASFDTCLGITKIEGKRVVLEGPPSLVLYATSDRAIERGEEGQPSTIKEKDTDWSLLIKIAAMIKLKEFLNLESKLQRECLLPPDSDSSD